MTNWSNRDIIVASASRYVGGLLASDYGMLNQEAHMRTLYNAACFMMLSLSLLVGSNKAKADLISALDLSFALTAQAQSGFSNTIIDTDAQSQGSTINPLSIAASHLLACKGDQFPLVQAVQCGERSTSHG